VGRLGRDDTWPVVGLGAIVAALFAEALLGGRVFFERDVTLLWEPQAEALARVLRAGSWPTWNPYHSFGVPLLANPNTQVFYPLTWLGLAMRPATYYSLYVVVHVLVSGTGLYVLGRRLGLSRAGAFVASAAWILSGPVLSLVQLWNHLAGAAWLPWTLVAADAALGSGRRVHAVAWGATMALQVVAGAPELLLAGLLLSAGVAWRHVRRSGPARLRPLVRVARVGLLAVCVALGLSAVQWVPTVAAAWQTPRFAAPEAVRTTWSVHPARMLEVVLPVRVNQLPLPWAVRGTILDSGQVFLRSLYGGVAAALLALAALATGQRRSGWLAVAAGAAALVALGRHAWFYGLAVAVLPVLHAFRFPEKAMVVAAFPLALLAGVGLDACRRGGLGRRRVLGLATAGSLLVVGSCLAALAALGVLPGVVVGGAGAPPLTAVLAPARTRLAVAALLAVVTLAAVVRCARRGGGRGAAAALALAVVVDLLAANADLNPTAPREVSVLRPPALDLPRADDHSRLYVVDYALPGHSERYLGHAGGYALAAGPPAAWRPMAAARTYPHPFLLACFGVEGSYVADNILMYPSYLERLTRALFQAETDAELRLLRAGAVSRVVALHERGFENLVPLATLPSLFREPTRVFAVPDALPRSYVVGTVRVGSDEEALGFLRDSAQDLRAEVFASAGPARQADPAFVGHSTIELLKPDRVRLRVEASAPGTVVLVDTFDAGWTVTVDDRPAEPRRVNVSFRGVDVPPGRHRVEWVYQPAAVLGGAVASALSLLAVAALVGSGSGWRRRLPLARAPGPAEPIAAAAPPAASPSRPRSSR
jgi:hypothetical protein